RIPPPHPTSTMRLPESPPARRSICARRSGLISCSGLNSLVGSHQRCASALNLASSAGSKLAVVMLGTDYNSRSRCSLSCSQFFLPPARLFLQVALVDIREFAPVEPRAPVDPRMRHVFAAGGVNEMGHRVIARERLRRREFHRDQVRRLARRDRADT